MSGASSLEPGRCWVPIDFWDYFDGHRLLFVLEFWAYCIYIYVCICVCVHICVYYIYIYIDLAFRCFCDFQTIYALTAGRTFGSPAKVREDFVSVHSSGSHERMIRTWNGNDGNVPLFKTPIIVLITINTFTYPSGLGYISYLSTKLANCGAPY